MSEEKLIGRDLLENYLRVEEMMLKDEKLKAKIREKIKAIDPGSAVAGDLWIEVKIEIPKWLHRYINIKREVLGWSYNQVFLDLMYRTAALEILHFLKEREGSE